MKFSLGIAGATGLWFATYRYLDSPIQTESQLLRNKATNTISYLVDPLGRGRHLIPGVAGLFLGGYLAKNKTVMKKALVIGACFVVNDISTFSLKRHFRRHRPDTGDPFNTFDGPNGNKFHASLPSAHSSNAFVIATAVATLFKDDKWVPPLAYGLATLVALSRINANAHWASDVFAGAALGFLSAKSVIFLYNKIDNKRLILFPKIGKSSGEVVLIYSL